MGDSSKETETHQQTSSTTTPITPSWATNALQDFTGRVQQWGATDPSSLVAPENALQKQAASSAANLGSTWQGTLGDATNAVSNATWAKAPTVSYAGYDPATYGSQGYDAATYGSQGYNATDAQSQSLLSGLSGYLNPYLSGVVGTTLSDFDQNAGQTRATQAAQAAKNGAFSDSRYGLREAATEDALARARASTEGGLLSNAFTTAAGLSGQDADRRQAVSLANAGAQNAASAFGASAANNAAASNASAINTARQFGASASNSAEAGNAAFRNAASQFGASAGNTAGLANAGYANDQLNRQLQGGSLLANIGTSADQLARGDIGTQADVGQTERGIDSAYRTADLNQLQALGALLQSGQFNLLTGQQTNGTSDGTQTTTESPSLFKQIGQGAQTAASLGSLFL